MSLYVRRRRSIFILSLRKKEEEGTAGNQLNSSSMLMTFQSAENICEVEDEECRSLLLLLFCLAGVQSYSCLLFIQYQDIWFDIELLRRYGEFRLSRITKVFSLFVFHSLSLLHLPDAHIDKMKRLNQKKTSASTFSFSLSLSLSLRRCNLSNYYSSWHVV